MEYKNKNLDVEKKLTTTLGSAFSKEDIEFLNINDLKEEISKKFKNKRDERKEI